MRWALAIALLGSTAWASTLTESNSASDLTGSQTCNSQSTLGSLAPQAIMLSGATTGTVSDSIASRGTNVLVFYSPAGTPNATSWASGSWTVKLNVSTANSNDTWNYTCILRVNSAGVAQATVASGSTSQSLGSTGVKSVTLSGTAQSASSTDRIAVVLVITNGHAGGQSFSFDAGNATNDTVATPLAAAYSRTASESLSFSDSATRRAALHVAASDTLSFSESAMRTRNVTATASESLSFSESAAERSAFTRTQSETASFSDSGSATKGGGSTNYTRNATETLAFSEVPWRQVKHAGNLKRGYPPARGSHGQYTAH